jgi:hypothetical protein
MNDKSAGLDRLLTRRRHHARVGHDRHVEQLVSFHERLDRRQHRGRLGLVALERVDHQWESRRAGQQADGDLRFQAAFRGEPGFAEPVPGVGLERQRRHVVEHRAGRAQPSVRGARCSQLLSPRLLREHGEATLDGRIRRRRDTRLLQHPQAVELAGRLDDTGQHELPEHFVPACSLPEPKHLVGVHESAPELTHPRRSDQQRSTRTLLGGLGSLQAQVELVLARGQTLPGDRPQDLQLGIIVRRAEVLDVPRPPPRGAHNLHRRRTRRGLHRAHLRGHQPTLRPGISAQTRSRRAKNLLLSTTSPLEVHDREPSQGSPPTAQSVGHSSHLGGDDRVDLALIAFFHRLPYWLTAVLMSMATIGSLGAASNLAFGGNPGEPSETEN